ERWRPPGVRRAVPPDLRLLGRTGIRRKDEAVLTNDTPQVRRSHSGFGLDSPQRGIERAHAPHPLEGDDDTSLDRNGAAGVARAAAARDDRDAAFVAPRNR